MNTEKHKFLSRCDRPAVDGESLPTNLKVLEMRNALNRFMKSRGMNVGRWGSSRDTGREHGR